MPALMQLLEMIRLVRKSTLSLTPSGPRCGSRISGRGFHKYEGVGDRFVGFISFV